MAFKTATVQTGKVVSTQSNFPVYVDLDRLGITTLAEAQSVRVYADEAKTTEWAREIVSVTEMHVKVPSLTSTVEIFVDWDGVRADYAVSATYGRNAVWSDYSGVYHLNEDPSGGAGAVIDSTGNYPATSGGSMTSGDVITGAFGGGTKGTAMSFDGDDFLDTNDGSALLPGTSDNTLTMWFKYPSTASSVIYGSYRSSDGMSQQLSIFSGKMGDYYRSSAGSYKTRVSATTINSGTWYKIKTNWDYSAKTINIYLNGSLDQAGGYLYNAGTVGNITSTLDTYIGKRNLNGGVDAIAVIEDEVRIKKNSLDSAEWEETEYNNQNDEATFWGTWTDAGGGGAAQSARRGAVMMM